MLYDFAAYWLGPIAAKLNIPSAFFRIMIAVTLGFIGAPSDAIDDRQNPEDFTVPPKWVSFPSTVAFRPHEIMKVSDGITGSASGVTDMYRFQEIGRAHV